MTRPYDHGDQFPNDSADPIPADRTADFIEIDYPVQHETKDTGGISTFDFEDETTLPAVRVKPNMLMGKMMESISGTALNDGDLLPYMAEVQVQTGELLQARVRSIEYDQILDYGDTVILAEDEDGTIIVVGPFKTVPVVDPIRWARVITPAIIPDGECPYCLALLVDDCLGSNTIPTSSTLKIRLPIHTGVVPFVIQGDVIGYKVVRDAVVGDRVSTINVCVTDYTVSQVVFGCKLKTKLIKQNSVTVDLFDAVTFELITQNISAQVIPTLISDAQVNAEGICVRQFTKDRFGIVTSQLVIVSLQTVAGFVAFSLPSGQTLPSILPVSSFWGTQQDTLNPGPFVSVNDPAGLADNLDGGTRGIASFNRELGGYDLISIPGVGGGTGLRMIFATIAGSSGVQPGESTFSVNNVSAVSGPSPGLTLGGVRNRFCLKGDAGALVCCVFNPPDGAWDCIQMKGVLTDDDFQEQEMITAVQVSGITLQKKTRLVEIKPIEGEDESDWTTFHTGTEC